MADYKEYFLFGEQMSIAYYSEDWEDFKKIFKEKITEWNFQLYDFDYGLENAEDLLSNYDGYMGWAKITFEEYKELDKIRGG